VSNPTWAFLYRHVIAELAAQYRCIAVDLPGFGLSDAPAGYRFTPAEHARMLASFVEALDLRDACLIAHDWGGPVGLDAMLATGTRIDRFVLGNTWAWPVNGDWHFEWFSRMMGRGVGRWANERHAPFVNVIPPTSMGRGRPSPEVMHAYRAPFAPPRSRVPLHTFAPQHPRLGGLARRPRTTPVVVDGQAAFVWPDRDIALRSKELARWRTMFPDAPVREIERCGHFLWGDAPEDSIRALRELLAADEPA
jgi:haloalkane dehalogenase